MTLPLVCLLFHTTGATFQVPDLHLRLAPSCTHRVQMASSGYFATLPLNPFNQSQTQSPQLCISQRQRKVPFLVASPFMQRCNTCRFSQLFNTTTKCLLFAAFCLSPLGLLALPGCRIFAEQIFHAWNLTKDFGECLLHHTFVDCWWPCSPLLLPPPAVSCIVDQPFRLSD